MRIAVVASDDLPAAGRVRRCARALADAGHHVTCFGVLADGGEPEEDDGPVVLVRTALERFERPQPGLGGLLSSRRAWRRMDAIVAAAMGRSAPEAVLAHGIEAAAAAWRAAGRAAVPFVYDEARPGVLAGGQAKSERDGGGAAADAVRAMERRTASALAEVLSAPLAGCIVASDALADAFLPRLPRSAAHPPERPVVVRDLPRFREMPRGEALRVRLGAWTTDRVLLYHAPLRDEFGLEVAVRALVHLGEGAILAVVGGAWCQDRIEALAESRGVAGRVKALPRPAGDDLARWLGSADAALFPLDPASPDAAMLLPAEAADCVHAGTPLVAVDRTETGRLVRDHGLGAVAPRAEAESFAGAVRTVLASPEAAGDITRAARRLAREQLCWERESTRLVGVFARIAARHGHGAGARAADGRPPATAP